MAWRFKARKTLRFGPVFVILTAGSARGLRPRISSWGLQVGPWRRNFTTRTTTVDTPGPGSISRQSRRSR